MSVGRLARTAGARPQAAAGTASAATFSIERREMRLIGVAPL